MSEPITIGEFVARADWLSLASLCVGAWTIGAWAGRAVRAIWTNRRGFWDRVFGGGWD